MANISQITIPNGTTYDIKDTVAREHSIEFIRGTWTAASGTWTGVTTDPELYDGKQIILYMPYDGSGNATLNLTLSGGGKTGAKYVYFEGTTRFKTQKGQNSQIHLIYHSALELSNGTTYEGWWYVANRDAAQSLETSGTIQTNLESTSAVTYTSGGNITPGINGTLPASHGGTGQTSLQNASNSLLNALSTGSNTPTDDDYYISQYVGGGETTTTYHRRPVSALWKYIKGKADSAYLAKTAVINNLTTTATGSALDAAQGKALNDKFASYLPLSGGTLTGTLTLHRTSSIETNSAAEIIFKTTQTDDNVTTAKGFIRVYDDHDTAANGTNMVIQSAGNMIIGGGESPGVAYTTDLENNTGENLYLTADGNIYFYPNANTYANHKSLYIDTNGDFKGSRYIYATYLNQSSSAETPTTDSYIMYANSDGFLRKSTLANVKTILGLGSASTHDAATTVGNNTNLPTGAAIQTYVTGLGYTKNTGTVTKVTAGDGLTGGNITTTGTIALDESGVTAGSAGPTAAVTGNDGTTVAIPRITVDKYGRVTALTSYNLTNKNTTYTIANNLTTTVAGSALDATQGKALSDKFDDYLPLAGGTVTGTLILSRATDLSGTANNKPALIVGGTDAQAHIEIDANEIQAKTNGTTTARLNLNTDGTSPTFVGAGGLYTSGIVAVGRAPESTSGGCILEFSSATNSLNFNFS